MHRRLDVVLAGIWEALHVEVVALQYWRRIAPEGSQLQRH